MRPKYVKWSSEDRATLRAIWASRNKEQIMAALPGRSWSSIYEMARILKINVTTKRCDWLSIAAAHKQTFFARGFL